jgi:hypothetical protein
VDRRRRQTLLKLGLKTALAVLVLFAVGRHVVKTWQELATRHTGLKVEPGPVLLAIVLYLVGLGFYACFFTRILRASPTPLGYLAALRAYYISHVGKYVPGKALVVVLRAGLSAPYGARPATAAFATVYETLVMMAAGGMIAAVGFAVPPVQMMPLLASLGLGVVFFCVVEPVVFPRLSRLITVPFPAIGPDALPRFSRPLLAEGLAWSAAGWVLLGLSQVAVIRAISGQALSPSLWPVVIGSVALATVAGFAVAILPAGLGVREWVLMTTLVPAVGHSVAVVSTLLLRLIWAIGEVAAATALAALRPAIIAPTSPPLQKNDAG